MSKIFECIKWDHNFIERMLKRAGGKYNFNFYGIRIWTGDYIGFINAKRARGKKNET